MSRKEKAPPIGGAPLPAANALPMAWLRMSHRSPDHMAANYLYAGYGSNLALAQMTGRCPGADIVGAGILRDARIVFAYHMGIVADPASTVPVGVYKLTAADVAALDRYEALGRKYERILVTCEVNGQAVRCFTYLKKNNEPQAPAESYYAVCLQGYNDWQFDTRRLRHAREYAVKHAKPRPASDAGTYRSDEPLGNGSAASYARPPRSPRPPGGRLGGADFMPRIDERASLADFKRALESGRVPTQGKGNGAVAGATATGRDGTQWQATRGADGHLVWTKIPPK